MDFFYLSPFFEPKFVIFYQTITVSTRHLLCNVPLSGGPMKKSLKKILKNNKGQGVMEYVIISSLIGIVCITAVKGFGSVINERVEDMKKSIVKNIKNT